jgi:hypothetical protein
MCSPSSTFSAPSFRRSDGSASYTPEWDVASLEEHDWPGNLIEMHQELPFLLGLAEHKGVRATARVLGMQHNTLSKRLKRIGLRAGPVQGVTDNAAAVRAGARRSAQTCTALEVACETRRAVHRAMAVGAHWELR